MGDSFHFIDNSSGSSDRLSIDTSDDSESQKRGSDEERFFHKVDTRLVDNNTYKSSINMVINISSINHKRTSSL